MRPPQCHSRRWPLSAGFRRGFELSRRERCGQLTQQADRLLFQADARGRIGDLEICTRPAVGPGEQDVTAKPVTCAGPSFESCSSWGVMTRSRDDCRIPRGTRGDGSPGEGQASPAGPSSPGGSAQATAKRSAGKARRKTLRDFLWIRSGDEKGRGQMHETTPGTQF